MLKKQKINTSLMGFLCVKKITGLYCTVITYIPCSICLQGNAVFDFTGSGYESYGNCNAPRAVALSALIYCLRSMVKYDIPLNEVQIALKGAKSLYLLFS